jgi:hypothetical protein
VDAVRLKVDYALTTPLKGDSPAITLQNCRVAFDLVGDLVARGDYPTAVRMLAWIRGPAVVDADFSRQVQERWKEVEALRLESDRMTRDMAALKASPDNAALNLIVGKYLCFTKGNWSEGLPMLAKGSDEKLKELAKDELAAQGNADALARAGDGWWDLAGTLAGPSHAVVLQHAASLYANARAGITGLRRELLNTRIQEAMALQKNAPTNPAQPGGPIDLIALVDPARDVLRGTWVKSNGQLSQVLRNPQGALLAFPVHPNGDYEIDLKLVRQGGADFNLIFPIGDHASRLIFGLDGGRSGIYVDRKKVTGGLAGVNCPPGQEVEIKTVVRVAGGSATVTANLDGTEVIAVNAPVEQIFDHLIGDYGVDTAYLIQIRTNTGLAIHAATLHMLSGNAVVRPAPPVNWHVTLVNADYGTAKRTMSLTQVIQKALDADPFTPIEAGNSWGGDPVPGGTKTLTLTYRIGDITQTIERSENHIFILPPIPKTGLALPGASIPFKIVAARYGADNRWVDATDAIRAELVDPSQSMTVHNMAGRDLLFGKIKRLVVYYEIQGRRYVHITDEKSAMTLIPKS